MCFFGGVSFLIVIFGGIFKNDCENSGKWELQLSQALGKSQTIGLKIKVLAHESSNFHQNVTGFRRLLKKC